MLKFLLDSLDGLTEDQAKMYKKLDDGKFQLQVDGLPSQADNANLLSALQKERKEVATLTSDLASWKKLGVTPDAVTKTITDLKAERGDPTESEKLLEQATARHNEEKADWQKELSAAHNSEKEAVINSGLTAALAQAGFTDTGLSMIPKLHGNRVKMVERGGIRVPEILTADGTAPLVGSGENSRATFGDLAKEFAAAYPDLVRADRKGGGGSGSGNDDDSGNTITRSDYDAMSHADRSAAMASGKTLVD